MFYTRFPATLEMIAYEHSKSEDKCALDQAGAGAIITPAYPKPRLSWKWSANSLAYTISFLGTHPRSTQL